MASGFPKLPGFAPTYPIDVKKINPFFSFIFYLFLSFYLFKPYLKKI